MADVQSQMEVNGLPTKFDTTSNQTAEDHAVNNIAATISNAEAPRVNDIKQAVPAPLESSSLVEPVTSTTSSLIQESQPVIENNDTPVTNGQQAGSHEGAGAQVNGHSVPSMSQPALESNLTDSFVPSSVPGENSASMTSIETSQVLPISLSESAAVHEALPVSNLRTEPHSDALAPEAVAEIEERKHQEDNMADTLPLPTAPLPLPVESRSDVSAIAPAGDSLPLGPSGSIPEPEVSETRPIDSANGDNVLQHTSTQSPPPPPEPAHATLPADVPGSEFKVIPPPIALEKPAEPAPTPVIPATPATVDQDISMEDAPAPKAAREREDDDMEEPVAKRARTDEIPLVQEAEFKIPETPTAVSASKPSAAPEQSSNNFKLEGDDSVTVPRLMLMRKTISNLKKSKASTAFRIPVDYVALNIPNYPQVVSHPMDLGTIDQKLKNNGYTSVQDFIADFELIVNNCIAFNGKDHGITQQALTMQNSFNNQMQSLPPVTHAEPSKAEKKAAKLKTESVRAVPPRRQSVTTPASAKSPKSAVTATTPSFAPGPDGMPLIRRDSNMVDGRPKRAIVPPKRNSDFAGVRPKKKKYELELRFCQEVLKEISSTKNWALNQYFTHPVDPVALNIPTYFQVIKKPMDLGTIQTKLDNNQYEKAKEFEEDVRLVFKNCYKFNPESDYVNTVGHQLEELFDRKWAGKADWIAAREPQSEPQSDAEEEEDDAASEEADDDSDGERSDKIRELQEQIAALTSAAKALAEPGKKKKSPPVAAKKASKTKPKKEKAVNTFPGLVKTKEKKKPATKAKAEKDRYVTFAEKQYISNGIQMLPERPMQEALRIIQQSVPALANSDGEIELDIEEVPNHALLKLLTFVKKYAGPPPDEPDAKTESFAATAASTKSKKNKPMSKQEQEAQIEELKGKLGAYGGPVSPDAVQSVEGNESSDESDNSEESEEE